MNEIEGLRPLLRLRGVERIYHSDGKEVQALRGVDLDLPRGELAALIGRSGSGKTTLLNLVGGLDRPTHGEIEFDGRLLAALSDKELTQLRRHKIGFIFQSFALLPTYSAYENVELILRLTGAGRQSRMEQAQRCLRLVGLEKWIHHRPGEMSGGQQQRVAIARALATQPALILADEPTGELDSATSRQIFSLFQMIVKREGITILLSTHDPLIDEFADIKFRLDDGRLNPE
jgi:putative ABC transport system ATP-binding protein